MSRGELTGRVAIVTGAASGIGRAVAELLVHEGASVVMVDTDSFAVDALTAEIRATGGACSRLVGDVSETHVADAAVNEAVNRFGRLDLLVNNAGIPYIGTVLSTPLDEWERVFAVNVRSVYLFSRAAIPELKHAGGGAIVSTASEAGLVGFHEYAAYSASKAAVINLTRSMALDHAADGIRVNCVCPGSICTPLLERYYEAQSDPVGTRRLDKAAHPLGLGTPEDVANGVLYLASDRSTYVTGHTLVVDGGYTAQ